MTLRLQPDTVLSRRTLTIHCIILLFLVGTLPACASEAPAGAKIQADEVWSRPALAMGEMSGASGEANEGMGHAKSGTGAVYMKLVNKGREADRLIRAQTDVAEVAEIHETRVEGEVITMQHLPNGLEIPAEGAVELKPGGFHVMLIGLRHDLKEGDRFSMVLEFEKSGTMAVEARVRLP